MILGLIAHLIAFIFAIVAACRKGYPFPTFWIGGLFVVAGNISSFQFLLLLVYCYGL